MYVDGRIEILSAFFSTHTYIHIQKKGENKISSLSLSFSSRACMSSLSLLMRSVMGCVYVYICIYKMQQTVKKRRKKKEEQQHILEK